MVAMIGLGVFLALCGVFLLWSSIAGREWSNTHNRAFQRTPHVGPVQTRVNLILGTAGGVVALALGIVAIVLGARK